MDVTYNPGNRTSSQNSQLFFQRGSAPLTPTPAVSISFSMGLCHLDPRAFSGPSQNNPTFYFIPILT